MASRKEAAAERRERRRLAKERLAAVRVELRDARVRRKQALVDTRERCRAERLATRERLRAVRIRTLYELRETGRIEREAARASCATRRADARALKDDVGRAKPKLAAERELHAQMRRIEHDERARHVRAPACVSCRAETDEEVLASIPSQLAPLFERVRRTIKGTPRMSRTEALLKYAESHAEEVLAVSQDADDARVRELERRERGLAKEAGHKPNPYEAKKAARIERMRARAERLAGAAEGAHARARQISDMIPAGQPILVGHHSEKRHRRDIGRIQQGFSRAHELAKEAKELERRADRAEAGHAVSSDDPEAVAKLRAKLEKLEAERARMVAANKAVRSKDPRAALAAQGFRDDEVDKLLTRDSFGNLGVAPFFLRNAAAEAGRLRKRITELEARAEKPAPAAVVAPGARIEEAENRVRIVFDAKPADAVRAALKSAGFRWSPTVGAWQRHASNAAWYEAKRIVEALVPAGAPRIETVPPRTEVPFAHASNHNMLASGGPPERVERPPAARAEPAVKEAGLDTVQVAARIRDDIKEAVRRGELPKAKYSVKSDKYSMGSSIDVVASGLPFPVINPDAFIVEPGASWVTFDRARFSSRFTQAAQDVERKLSAIVDVYHWDRSDSMTDYYNERFAKDVRLQEDGGAWKQLEAAKIAEARASEAREHEVRP